MNDHFASHRALDLGRMLRRHWLTLALTTAAALGLGVAYCQNAEKIFQSNVEILVIKKQAGATSVNSNGADMQDGVEEDILATHIRLFGSSKVVERAIEKHGLAELPGVQGKLVEDMTAAGYIREHLDIGRGGEGQAKDAQVLTAAFSHTEPEEARLVLGALVEAYQSFLDETFNNIGSKALGIFKEESEKIGKELADAEAEYQKFRGEAPLMFSGDDTLSVYENELVQLSSERRDLVLQRSLTKSRLDAVQASINGPKASTFTDSERLALIDDQHVQRLSLLVNVERGDAISEAFQADQPARSEAANAEFDKLVSLRTQAGILRNSFGARHPRVSEIAREIAELEGLLRERNFAQGREAEELDPAVVVSAYVKLLENDIEHLDRRIAETDAIIADAATEARKLNSLEAKDRVLTDRLARNRELHNAFLARLPELGMATDLGTYETPVIEPATPAAQVWPNLIIVGALSVVAGLGTGLGIAVWSEMADRTFQSSDEIAEAVDAPVLGVVPRLIGAEVKDSPVDGKVVALHKALSTDAEAIRSVRTALFFAARGEDRSVVQVTSPTASDGKSLVSSNVAVALASAGKKVLLVDADMRKPTQHGIFFKDLKPEHGLSDLLIDQVDLPDAVLQTAVENLELLPAGPLPPNPAELLTMPRFEELVGTLREKYEYVVIDTPPTLVVSDPLNVAPRCDGVILVTPVKKDMAGATQHAAAMLREVECNLLGAVVNDLEGRLANEGGGYGNYGKYGGSYAYAHDQAGYTSSKTTSAPAPSAAG
ncbi:MAG: polysaccharide biosynthesis tyrosine autokinase [Planctomycetota bacterium]